MNEPLLRDSPIFSGVIGCCLNFRINRLKSIRFGINGSKALIASVVQRVGVLSMPFLKLGRAIEDCNLRQRLQLTGPVSSLAVAAGATMVMALGLTSIEVKSLTPSLFSNNDC